jgi:hypothetical protein
MFEILAGNLVMVASVQVVAKSHPFISPSPNINSGGVGQHQWFPH